MKALIFVHYDRFLNIHLITGSEDVRNLRFLIYFTKLLSGRLCILTEAHNHALVNENYH